MKELKYRECREDNEETIEDINSIKKEKKTSQLINKDSIAHAKRNKIEIPTNQGHGWNEGSLMVKKEIGCRSNSYF